MWRARGGRSQEGSAASLSRACEGRDASAAVRELGHVADRLRKATGSEGRQSEGAGPP